MRGSRRKGRRPGTWELRIDAGVDPLSGRRRQRSVVFEGTAREADAKLAELNVDAGAVGSSRAPTRSRSC